MPIDDAPPDVPAEMVGSRKPGYHDPRPAFIHLGDGKYANRADIVASWPQIGQPGSVVLFASGQQLAGNREHEDFLKELLS